MGHIVSPPFFPALFQAVPPPRNPVSQVATLLPHDDKGRMLPFFLTTTAVNRLLLFVIFCFFLVVFFAVPMFVDDSKIRCRDFPPFMGVSLVQVVCTTYTTREASELQNCGCPPPSELEIMVVQGGGQN